MSLELLKVMVQPVAIERDTDGNIVGEKVGDPVAIFALDNLQEYVDALRKEIAAANGKEEG